MEAGSDRKRFLQASERRQWLAAGCKSKLHSRGASLIQWQDNGNNNQQGLPVDVGGYLVLVNRNSGLTMDVNQGAVTAGAAVNQWADNGGSNQQWNLVKIN
ncbi:RICIN domain-containing protein [Paenibacillus sp. RC334]|uniref:RICIN domain-containing protein n=1 Tax=Paenibacillus sp. RC334 TaxID=3045840 RepID=UPI0024BBB0FC|nr:RICIN domain-containing protein [Paenibacillus sp. RC334]